MPEMLPSRAPVKVPDLKALGESDLQVMFDKKIYERGKAYYKEGRIKRPLIYGNMIIAECEGSTPENYTVKAELTDKGITASCSCPYPGYCKHIAAVMYGWVKMPSMFRDLNNAELELMKFNKDDLVELIMDVVRYEPGILPIVNTRLMSVRDLSGSIRQELDNIFSGDEHEHPDVSEILKRLDVFRQYSSELLDDGYISRAVSVISPVIDGVISHYGSIEDYAGDLRNFLALALGTYGKAMSLMPQDLRRDMMVEELDWYLEAEFGLEDVLSGHLKSMILDLKERKFMQENVERRISDYKKSLIKTAPEYSDEYDFLNERISRMTALLHEIRA
ncbi:hypothetical protein CUJ83_10765 [Methanocella sp. CWC-04]|uniref:SWIM-type domain-containing protein n=1 Tax=Methanooceanicella nereidis TaxID=2052831 RepID=A0AAP2RG41_9EURY|nr:SWIM zinc finger family protein [Methanocella sp. CWC-04]MCD1295480.1 hypothetical protein [Methanocella sp. CWC-04]